MMQPLHRRWRILVHILAALCVASLLIRPMNAQCSADQQPIITDVDPPSGSRETVFVATGVNLDVSATITAIHNGIDIITDGTLSIINNGTITFTLNPSNTMPVTFTIDPDQEGCETASFELSVVVIGIFVQLQLDEEGSPQTVQPGTTILSSTACLPLQCGDDSTDYRITVADLHLEEESADEFGFVARLPDTSTNHLNIELIIVTFYSSLQTNVFLNFRTAPPITSITPNRGQRGTRVVIEGENLLGFGIGKIVFKQVIIGSSEAEVDEESNSTTIYARVKSGDAGTTSILVNTTQKINDSFGVPVEYDGPYTFSDSLWIQLEDGVITDIIPPAVQIGGSVRMCGERLLGGGSSIVNIAIAEQEVDVFDQVMPNPDPDGPSECFQATVPSVADPENLITGRIAIEADTGAIVESVVDFTYAVITDVNPNQGQVGTEVTISGIGLLSGYTNVQPTVYLSNVEATVVEASTDRVVVRVEDPNDTIAPFSGSGEDPTPDIINVAGDTVIRVTIDDRDYNLSLADSWTYLEAGTIDLVDPNFGQVGTRITLTGTNLLGYGSDLTRALVSGVVANVVSSTNSRVEIDAPDIQEPRLVDIVLESNNGALVRLNDAFEYRERGVITNLNPDSGQNGTFVTISGTNLFGHADSITSVTFGDLEADVVDSTSISNSQIRVRIRPNDVIQNTPVTVVITASTMARVSSSVNDWTYLVPGQVVDVQPNIGQRGTVVTINGTNLLGGGSSVQSIFLDGVSATVIGDESPTSINVTMDDLTNQTDFNLGTVYIVADTGAVIMGGVYNHRMSGMVTNIDPNTGREGSQITITGNNLAGYGSEVTGVMIAGVQGEVINQLDESTVVIQVGLAPGGTVGGITLTSDTGAIVTSDDGVVFTYTEQGIIFSVNPPEGAEGSGILIEGTSLRPTGTRVISVIIGGSPVSRIVTESESEISVVVGPAPEDGGMNATIIIMASDGSLVRGGNFTYLMLTVSLPGLTFGQQGTRVKIRLPDDDDFDPSLDLVARIGEQTAETVSSSVPDQIIEVAVPRGRDVGTYTVDVAVEGIDGRVARIRNGFTYIEEGVIISVTPDRGQLGTKIRVVGRNLLGGGAVIQTACIGDRGGLEVNASVTYSDDESVELELQENLPAGSSFPLLGDITLIADTGATIIGIGMFTLIQPGEIQGVTPSQGQFGTVVIISGFNLLEGGTRDDIMSITLAGTEVSEIVDIPFPPSDSEITVRANISPASEPGEVNITLITGARIITPSSITFQYLSPGVINTVTPNIGTEGTYVSIVGDNLLGGGIVEEVSLAGTPADVINTPTDSQIEVRARKGNISIGIVEIRIDTGAVISGGVWEYEELGIITVISPTVGQQGVTVTISGFSLLGSSSSEFTNCSLAGVPGIVIESRDDEATCIAGFNPAAGRETNISQLTGPVALIADSGPIITSEDPFTYYVAYIEDIDPINGTNGTFVTISGVNLIGPDESSDSDVDFVTFGDTQTLSSATEVLSRDSIRVRVFNPTQETNEGLTVRVQLQSGVFLELEDAWNYTAPGEIMTVFPPTALPGSMVTINGTDLVPPCVSEVTVIVGQTESYEATIISSSEVTFRPGPYQETIGSDTSLEDPNVPIPIQVIASNGATVYNDSVLFQYEESTARIDTIAPIAGSGGTEVTITGINLLNGGFEAVRVTLAGQESLTVISSSGTEVIVLAGDGPVNGGSGRVIIESDNGLVSGIGTDVWLYLPQLTAADVSPQSGQSGTTVSIDLKRIYPFPIARVFLGEIQANGPTSADGTRIIVEANPSPETPVTDIRIEFHEGVELVIPNAWSYLPQVEVTDLVPNRGYFNTVITIQGANLQAGGRPVDYVEVAGLTTELISQIDTEITVRVTEFIDSSLSEISGPVLIVFEDDASYMTDDIEFTYVQLSITEVVPSFGQGGTVVGIYGIGLLAGSSNQPLQEAQLGGVDVQNQLTLTDTLIELVASNSLTATNESDVRYVVADGGLVVIPDSWYYIEPGQVTDVTPLEGAYGSYITIRGVGMLQGGTSVSEVTVAGVPVMSVVVGENDFIQVRLGQAIDSPVGFISIESNTGALLETTSFIFTYISSVIITAIEPTSGQYGTRVIISGSMLTNSGSVSKVYLAGIEATNIRQVSGESITVDAERPDVFEEFSGEVIIETESGVIITGDVEFTYLQEGYIFEANPSQGQVGTRVIISGERLLGGGTSVSFVSLAGVAAEIDESNSNDSIVTVTAMSSDSAPISGDIIVVANTGASVRKIGAWSYVEPGDISIIDPPQGQFGTEINIIGIGLLSGGDSVTQIAVGTVITTNIISSNDFDVVARVGQPPTSDGFTDTVTITSNFGGEFSSTFSWTYLDSSRVDSVSQSSGIGGAVVMVHGERLLGGGSQIISVTTAGIEALDIDDGTTSNNTVVFTVNFHPTGADIQGDIIIVSDTGATTIIENGWSYDIACPSGQFGQFANCMPCNDECTNCDGPTNEDCFTCSNFIIPLTDIDGMRCVNQCPNVSTLNNVCVDACNSNQYVRTDTLIEAIFCYDCNELCDDRLGCSGPDPTECNGCEVARDRDSQACVAFCEINTWKNQDRVCVPCHSQCEPSAGCFGETNADCTLCRNVRISSFYYNMINDGSTSGSGQLSRVTDICIQNCPTRFYVDDDGDCLPCDDECLGGCTGRSAFNCNECSSASRIEAGEEMCVATCNSGLTDNTLFEDTDGSCRQCSELCSIEKGCTGPTNFDCIACAKDTATNRTLPKFDNACVLACPNTTSSASPTPTVFYYHDIATGTCERCTSECSDGCTGPTADDCIQRDEPETDAFSAGAGTIGVTVAIIVMLVILLIALVILVAYFMTKRYKGRGYKMTRGGRDIEAVEMDRYAQRPNDPPKKVGDAPKGAVNERFEEAGFYTPMSPTESVAATLKRSPEHGPIVEVEEYNEVRASMIIDSSIIMIGNEDAELYCDPGTEPPDIPVRPAKPPTEDKTKSKKPPADKTRKISASKSPPAQDNSQKSKRQPPVKSTSSTSISKSQGKKAAAPPPTDPEPEMYTDMTASVQQVYVQPQDEEYSEMSHVSPPDTGEVYSEMSHIPVDAAVEEQMYEDTANIESRSSQQKINDTTPLIEDLYEDTDVTVTSPDYHKHAVSTSALPSRVPDIPRPRKKSAPSVPLPQTPLEQSIQKSLPPTDMEVLYEATDAIPEESLYEAITTHGRALPAEPSPDLPPKVQAKAPSKGTNKVPLPPKGGRK